MVLSGHHQCSRHARGLVMVVGAFSLAAILHFLREMAAQAAAQAAQNLLQCVTALQQSLRMLEHFLELWPKLRLIRNRPFLNIHTLRLCKTL